jgi:hypothetical protein
MIPSHRMNRNVKIFKLLCLKYAQQIIYNKSFKQFEIRLKFGKNMF